MIGSCWSGSCPTSKSSSRPSMVATTDSWVSPVKAASGTLHRIPRFPASVHPSRLPGDRSRSVDPKLKVSLKRTSMGMASTDRILTALTSL